MNSPETAKLLHAFSALADLGEEIAATRDFGEMVRSTLHVVLGALGVRRGAVAEHDAAASSLKFVASWGFGDATLAPVTLGAGDVEALAGGWGRAAGDAPPARALASAEHFGARVTRALAALQIEIVTPLVVHNEFVGLILLGGKATDEPFSQEEREVVRTMARHIGVGIHNHRLLRELDARAAENRKLYEDLRGIYRDTVRAFAAAIDSKDKYTQGHSERVGRYCEIIAREMGWDDGRVEAIAVGGYLHDVGKLVVERDIINAPYKIDAKQSSELNRHPAAGYDILIPIQHPDADIPLMAKYHHERLDGRGYPEGLSGDEIPLSAKIVSVADSFDAMTTDRTYKRRKELPEVVEDFLRNTGKQFEPEPVRALFRALLRELDGESQERRFARLLGKEYLAGAGGRELVAGLLRDLDAAASATASAA